MKPTVADRLVDALVQCRFVGSDEYALQDGVGATLVALGVTFEPEAVLSAGSRIDFLADPDVGIEVKTAGSSLAVARQLKRYAECGQIGSLVLVTTVGRHRSEIPETISGVPVTVAVVRSI